MNSMNNRSATFDTGGWIRNLALLVITVFALGVQAATPPRLLQSIDVVPLPGDRVLLTLNLSGPAPEPIVFTVAEPARLSIDLPETQVAMRERHTKVDFGNTQAITIAQAKQRSRVVVELTNMAPYKVNAEGNRILVQIGSGPGDVPEGNTKPSAASEPETPVAPAVVPAPEPAAAPLPVPVTPTPISQPATAAVPNRPPVVLPSNEPEPTVVRPQPAEPPAVAPRPPITPRPAQTTNSNAAGNIQNLDFRRGENGEGRIIIRLSNENIVANVEETGGKIAVQFDGAAVGNDLRRRLDVLDFATPVKFIDTNMNNQGAKVVITPIADADFERAAYQTGNLFTVELQPLTQAEVEARQASEPKYTGERITFDFQNVEVRRVLQIIAEEVGFNIVVSDSVGGNATLRLINVPWDQALDVLLKGQGLGKREEGNVVMIGPLAEIQQQELEILQARTTQEQAAPLISELVQINYAKASDISALLKSGENSQLTERGRISVDERTNTLLILETRSKLEEVRKLISRLDIPVRQVLIETRIVVANDDFSKDLGARFGVTQNEAVSDNLLLTQGTLEGTDTTVDSLATINPGDPVAIGALPQRLNFNLPVAGGGSAALAILGTNFLIDLELSALQAENRGEILSNPRVVTSNGTEAYIQQGVEIPFLEAASSGTATISFKEAVLNLTVTPQITPDERIIMDLLVTQDSVGAFVPVQGGGTVPSINTREVQTQVLVDNGETVVLGGIYEQTNLENVSKVPFLGDVPLLGAFFRNRSKTSNKVELLVFVTPKILNQGLVTE